MDATLRRAVARRLAEAGGGPAETAVEITAAVPVAGGSINRAFRVDLADGRRLFVKAHAAAPGAMFEREAEGLGALAAAGALRVPREPLPGTAAGVAFLVMEWIEPGRPGPGFFERFGRSLARLHRASAAAGPAGGRAAPAERFGFRTDNWLGSTPQPNDWAESWVGFWRERRLGHQLRLARARGLSDRTLDRLGDRLLARLGEWIDLPGEPPCLLHGDLWGGNYLADERGEPVLIDPACYYGHREADLAMTRLFGGFSPAFYAAYEEEWPLPPGSEERLAVYELYHLLNHLNLFGRSYRGRCVAVLERLVGPG
jgi:fructosamine-3-kinase